jgi:hypothetical protein
VQYSLPTHALIKAQMNFFKARLALEKKLFALFLLMQIKPICKQARRSNSLPQIQK